MGVTGQRWGIGKGQPIPEDEEARGPWRVAQAGGPPIIAVNEGLPGLLKVCKKMSWQAQQAWCYGRAQGPR